jgi:copper chaperone CopZ
MKSVRIVVDGLINSQSSKMIKDDIEGFTGVSDISLALPDNSVTIKYDPTLISEEKLKQALESKGCTVKETIDIL